MPGHAFQGSGRINEAPEPFIPVIKVPQGLGQPQGLVQLDVQRRGHLLCHGVALGITDVQGPAHVPDGSPGGHGTESDYLGHMVRAIFLVYIIYNLAPAVYAEVDVYIRHANALRVKETLKKELVLNGVHVGYVQTVGDHAARGASPAGAHGYLPAFGIGYKVADYEEIVHETHFTYHIQLIVKLLSQFFRSLPVVLFKTCLTEFAQVCIAVRLPFRKAEFWQVIMAEFIFEIAHIGNFLCVFNGLRAVREKRPHFLLGFEVKIIPLELHAVRVIYGLAGLDAHEHILIIGVLPGEIMGVVSEHQGYPGLVADSEKALHGLFLLLNPVVLEFQIKIAFSKGIIKL